MALNMITRVSILLGSFVVTMNFEIAMLFMI